jgi:hypothetical protein
VVEHIFSCNNTSSLMATIGKKGREEERKKGRRNESLKKKN